MYIYIYTYIYIKHNMCIYIYMHLTLHFKGFFGFRMAGVRNSFYHRDGVMMA